MKMRTGLLIGLFAILVSGCKVSVSEDYNDSPGHDFTPGLYLDARDTGDYFPSSSWSLSQHSDDCIDETLYFETASGRVRVYGSPAYSDTDFRAAATELEHGIDGVLSRFQLRWSEFVSDRTAEVQYPGQILGCLSPSISRTEFADASISAIGILPHYSQWPYETDQIISHQLAHFVQENLSRYQARYTLLPYWFAEGQASVVAGESIASAYQHYDYDPLEDATVLDAGPADYRFEHYALAYRYLEEANGKLAMTILLDLIQLLDWEGGFEDFTDTGESWAFVEAFNAAGLVDHRNQSLTWQRYKADYHYLLSHSY
ncbi:hypothetical protein KFJ24_17095 [Marinobacter sediminum]|uniref:hypothetical protein n=1 Tax=Marinobacter sediminum TaxID=256323 RepID=UPI0020305F8A|nr:hypothetical protein [Marinobacter sediminum]MCM0614208.1 hypothetical protein [Marinobacter sediminum]